MFFQSMRILPISLIRTTDTRRNEAPSIHPFVSIPKTQNRDIVTFTGISHGGNYLRKLAAYGLPDMYTGKPMLAPIEFEHLQQSDVFKKGIATVVKVVSRYEKTLQPVESLFFNTIKKMSKSYPDINLKEAVNMLKKPHEDILLGIQQKIFQKLILLACDMPEDLFKEFAQLMNITNRRLLRDPVVVPFSEKEFNYKLKRISIEILSKNNKHETKEIKKFIELAEKLFPSQGKEQLNKRSKMSIQKKLEAQMKPEVLKNNSQKLQKLYKFFYRSRLRHNSDLRKLLDETGARIHEFPYVEQFTRKSFIHDIHGIANRLEDKVLAEKIKTTVISLPTSTNNLSAFIVKYSDSNSYKIGFHMMNNACASIDHLVARNNGGHDNLSNFGLCAKGVNNEKTNIDFAKWIKLHPQSRRNCQKYINSLIDLYYRGILDRVGLPVNYIIDFAETIRKISPKEKPINLDLSKLGLY